MNNNKNHVLFILLVALVLVWNQRVLAEGGVGTGKCIDQERYALLDFKAHILRDPDDILSTWRVEEEEDCCKWRGVTCNNQTGHVTELHCFGRLEGEISHSLLNLTYLSSLDLSYNSFNGTIPTFIGSLTELRYLDLSGNSFNGTIPKSIGSLNELRSLDLSYNSFHGTIPPEFGNLTNLEHLSLRNLKSCTIENLDWLYGMSQLQSLYMDGTSLAKADNWVNVIISLPKLYDLSLRDCELSHVSHPYSSSFNSLSSSSSSSIATLDLENNNLNSSMYNWLFPLTNNISLYTLDLSGNKLDMIPTYFGNLCSLRHLYLNNNSIVANFSDILNTLSGCTSLQYLFLSHNQLHGSISEKLLELPNLYFLDLSSNSLRGPISQNIANSKMWCSWLFYLNLSSNYFYGPVPDVPSTLKILDLSSNRFSGGIFFLCKIVDGVLEYLDLSHNSFSGQLPDCLWHFKDLIVLNLGNNRLSGRIPGSVESLIQLEVLCLYNNTFSGELPSSLKNCTRLNFLDLGENNFSGNLPVWIGENLSGLYALSLKSNNFSGPIPLQLCQLVHLQILDLSKNHLYGTIPSCLNNLTSMVQKGLLSSQNVHFYAIGYLHISYVKVRYVDHEMIQWQGNIQEFSTNLRLLKSIDLSSNNLTGKIPYELTDLDGLVALNLSKNTLIGEIPQSVGQMKELEILDLSRNSFSGKIPSSISQMASLSYLDVSFNNLSGRVPTGSQLQTFEPSWFAGNAELCGLPATNHCPGDEKVPPTVGESEDREDVEDDLERWFYIGGASGFATGFWIVCSSLLLNRRGRHAFFSFLDNSRDWVYVMFIAKSGARA